MIARRTVLVAGLSVCLLGVARAGDLNPPVGPIEATMVTLDQVEPRVCINDLPGSPDAMHVITQPGSYFLAGPVLADPGKSAIVVQIMPGVEGHTIVDLNGFPLTGQGGGGGCGMRVTGGPKHEASIGLVRNIKGRTVISGFAEDGVQVVGGGHVEVSGLHVRDCDGNGVSISSTAEATIDVSVRDCLGNGVAAQAVGKLVWSPRSNLAFAPAGQCSTGRVTNVGGHGLVATQCGDVTVSGMEFSQCAQDGLHFVDTLDIALSSVSVLDGGANGVSVTNGRRLSACCIGSSGEDGVEVRVARVFGHGMVVVGGSDQVAIAASVVDVGLDGVRVEDASRCDISASVVGAGGNGITALRIPDMSCGVAIKTKGTGADKNRVASTGGNGLHFVDCGEVEVHGMTASSCQGDGLHVSGASSVSISDWRDNDCDDDGIEITAGAGSPPVVHVRDSFSNRAGGNGATIVCKMGRVELARFTGATGHGIDIEGDNVELSECSSNGNGQRGVSARGRKSLCTWYCVTNDNGWDGTFLAPALGSVQEKAKQVKCSAHRNGFSLPGGGSGFAFDGVSSVEMLECDASGNAGSGIRVADLDRDGRLDLVTCSSNGLYGIHVPGPTSGLPGGRFHVTRAACDANGADGLYLEGTTGGEVRECAFSNNAGLGLHVLGSSHVVRSNTCTSNGAGPIFVLAPGNVVGPLVDELTVAGNCNPAANYVH